MTLSDQRDFRYLDRHPTHQNPEYGPHPMDDDIQEICLLESVHQKVMQ